MNDVPTTHNGPPFTPQGPITYAKAPHAHSPISSLPHTPPQPQSSPAQVTPQAPANAGVCSSLIPCE
jgi:hypothetical protein